MNDCTARLWSRLTTLSALLNIALFASAEGTASESPRARSDAGFTRRNPVLLIHGIYDSAASMQTLRVWLATQGWQVFTLSLVPNDGSVRLEALAQQVHDYIAETFPRGQKIDLVGFSMGGLVCRYYVQRLGGTERVARFVSISAPNHGSRPAYLSNKPGCVQMRPGSAFLRELNTDISELEQVQFTLLWSPLDLTILPARSSRMAVGKEITKWVIAHPLMVLYPGCLHVIAESLAESFQKPVSPRAADCQLKPK